jgi:hypothetical protein
MEKLDRRLIIELQRKMLQELQDTLSTEDLYYTAFWFDDGTRGGRILKSTSSEYIKAKENPTPI